MKTLGGIGAMILGVIAVLVSFGLQTIWAPPAVFNATTETSEEAPLTIITDGVDIDPDEAIEYTMTGDGEFTLMYGQLRDIEAWVGDAAHHRIDGVDTNAARGDDPTVNISHHPGQMEVPNPVDSDLWLATQEVSDAVTQRWARVDEGQWALLVAVDGTAPAPTDFSVSWVNIEPNSPLIVPLMIAGIALLLIGIVLLIWRFLEFRRRAKRTSGRRAVRRGDYTGLTAADVMADAESSSAQRLSVEQVDAGLPVEDPDEQQATEVVSAVPAEAASAEAEVIDETEDEDVAEKHDAEDQNDDEAPPGNTSVESDTETRPNTSTADDQPAPDADDHKDNGFLRRTITAVSALGLTIGAVVGPAHAQSATEDADLEDQVDEEQLEHEADPQQPETFPVVVDAQLEHILQDVTDAIAAADDALDADLLTDRVAGHALRARQDGYRNNTIDEDYPNRAPIAGDEILAAWMDRDESFPRTVFAVTADAQGDNTQLVVLQQDDPRAQYQLTHNAPFAPGAELPTGSLTDSDVEELAVDDAQDLVMSAQDAVDTLADYLSDPEADAADAMTANEWIELVHEHQASQLEDHADNDVEFSVSRTAFDDSITAVRLPNDSALVFGTMNSLESLSPQEDGATVDLDPRTQELGDFSSASQEDAVRIRYREQFALLVPPEGKISLAGYETVQSTVD